MDHKHIFDKDGICEICSQTMKVYKKANADDLLKQTKNHRSHQGTLNEKLDQEHIEDEDHNHDHDHQHDHSHFSTSSAVDLLKPSYSSFASLISGILFDYVFHFP